MTMRQSVHPTATAPDAAEALLGAVWDLELHDPFPPAKSDREIADLVSRMGEELGAFDTQTRARRDPLSRMVTLDAVTHPRIVRRRSPLPRRHRRRPPPVPAVPRPVPPPLPGWAWPQTLAEAEGARDSQPI
jgi:hypothetical protein